MHLLMGLIMRIGGVYETRAEKGTAEKGTDLFIQAKLSRKNKSAPFSSRNGKAVAVPAFVIFFSHG